MLDALDKFAKEVNTAKVNAARLPLAGAQYERAKPIYKLALKLKEFLRIIDSQPHYYDTVDTTYIVELRNGFNQLISCAERIRDAVTKEVIIKALDTAQLPIVMTISGIIHMDDHLKYRFPSYASTPPELSSSEIKEAYDYAVTKVSAGRTTVNTLVTFSSSCNSSSDINNSTISEIINSHAVFEQNNINALYHVYASSARGYNLVVSNSALRPHYHKLISGDSADVTISPKFDLGLMGTIVMANYCSSYSIDKSVIDNFKKSFLYLNSHVAYGAVECIGLPRMFMNEYVITLLSGYLDNLNVYSVAENSQFVVVVGNRRPAHVENLHTRVEIMLQVLTGKPESESVNIANTAADKILFRSAYPSMEEISDIISANSSSIARTNNTVMHELALKTEEEVRHPLLPFSPGQLGVVLVSGKIDGIIDEGDGKNFHVIKGATFKTHYESTTTGEEGQIVTNTTYATATSVVMLTADGQFKQLA